ncbi:AFG1 family ATPase [Marinihelvus fidelis]|uniref:Cell division protein ZapE n=1 Tax=Marinihelvus fidelis TaxID=2613842 RepID=A0A5N0TA81_9GAMM|nr:cell division protein ZapE [Marinihelvus fidelis]KAA9131364.1 AFG1 family ATPase [Marinihelvus fidelis]
MTTPAERYQQRLDSGRFAPDPEQARVVDALDALHAALVAAPAGGLGQLVRRLAGKPAPAPRGLYLWGGVGRGKTWLMDLFFETLPFEDKQRFHFHRFMARVHDALRERSHESDPIPGIAREWARDCRVLCFDEFFVSDIADAMLLAGLLRGLFDAGVTLVATSNVEPANLYRDGLQRARFLPAIDLLETHTNVMHVGGDTDHRLRLLERSETWHTPAGEYAETGLASSFSEMASDCELQPTLNINGREFQALRRGDGVIWFEFDELCEQPRGSRDYIEIARAFNTVMVSNIPVLDDTSNNAARRFIHLVDEFYDRNVKLLASAAAPIDGLYNGQRLAFEFDRTRSRLTEMQSRDYLARAHLA